MGRICTICASPESAKINAELIRTKGATTTVARMFGVSEKSMERHMKNHVKRSLRSLDSGDGNGRLSAASQIRLEVRKVLARNYRLSLRAEQEGRLGIAVSANREMAANLAFIARLQGVLDTEHGSTTNVNVLNLNVPESTLRRMAATYLENHPALPEGQPGAMDSPEGLLTVQEGIVEGDSNG